MIRSLRRLDLEFNHDRYGFLKYNCNAKRNQRQAIDYKVVTRRRPDWRVVFLLTKNEPLNNNFPNPQPKVVRMNFFGEISKSGV